MKSDIKVLMLFNAWMEIGAWSFDKQKCQKMSKGMLHVDVCGAGRQDPKEGWGCELEETIDQTDQTIGNCRFVSNEPSMAIDAIEFQQDAHPEMEAAVDCGNQVEARWRPSRAHWCDKLWKAVTSGESATWTVMEATGAPKHCLESCRLRNQTEKTDAPFQHIIVSEGTFVNQVGCCREVRAFLNFVCTLLHSSGTFCYLASMQSLIQPRPVQPDAKRQLNPQSELSSNVIWCHSFKYGREREGEDNRKKVTARMQSADIEQRSQLMKSNTGTLHVHPLALFWFHLIYFQTTRIMARI